MPTKFLFQKAMIAQTEAEAEAELKSSQRPARNLVKLIYREQSSEVESLEVH